MPVFELTGDPSDAFADEAYRALASAPPVARTPRGDYLITGHPEAVSILRSPHAEPRFDYPTAGSRWNRLAERFFVFLDGSTHRRLRSAFDTDLTRSAMSGDDGRIDTISAAHVEDFRARVEAGETADIIKDFAVPCTVEILASILGIDAAAVTTVVNLAIRIRSTGDEDREFLDRVAVELQRTAETLLYTGRFAGSLPNRIAAACDGDRELIHSTIALLLLAGFETSANLFGNLALALMWDPQRTRVLVDGGPSLLPTAVEELLRLHSPAHVVARVAREPIAAGDVVLPAEARIAVFLRLCNMDPRVFARPRQMNLHRTPNPHLAFSHGRHYCLGASLARLEIAAMLRALLPLLTRLKIDSSKTPKWTEQALGRSLVALPVRLEPRSS
ncbi:cytochrome P450 [Streptomyces rimosus]|uniref:cytochrome P450 n=1 Tax=Streptomyces rimosus TaxID=1927 RepID=UPI0013317974|nr:cytochrome P450 [Streptomyces rimosus]